MSRVAGIALPQPVGYTLGVQFGDSIAVIGGFNGSTRLDTVYLREASGEWKLLASEKLSLGRHYPAAFSVDKSKFPTC